MSQIQRISLLVLFFVVTGCAVIAGKDEAGAPPSAPGQAQAEPVPEPEQTLPAVNMDAELLYQLLTGEMAGHRGELKLSVQNYLRAAARTRDPRIAERAANIAAYARDVDASLQAARLWTEISPDDEQARKMLAMMLIKSGDPVAAEHELLKLFDDPRHDVKQVFEIIATLLQRLRDSEHANQVMGMLVARYPEVPEAHFGYSKISQQAGKLGIAQLAIERALQLRPGWTEAQLQYAHVLQQQGNAEEAVTYLSSAIDQEPDKNALRLTYARLLVEAKQLDKAREQFKLLLLKTPNNPEMLYALGVLSLQADDSEEAEKYLTRLLDTGQRVSEAAYYLGQIAEERKQPQIAADFYERVSSREYYPEAQMRMAVLEAAQGQVDAGLARLRNVDTKSERQRIRVHLTEGEILRAAKQYERAMEMFNEAVKEFPDNSDLLYARALMAEKVDRLDILMHDLQAILDKEPDNAHALNALGYTLADRTKRYDEALSYIRRALDLEPNDAAILDSMGWVQYRMGNKEVAVKYLRRALELNLDSEIAAHLGEVLWQTGDQSGAKKIWQKALDAAPDSSVLREVMQRFIK